MQGVYYTLWPAPGHVHPKLRLKEKPGLISLAGGVEGLPVTDPAARATPLGPEEWRDMLRRAREVNSKVEAGQEDASKRVVVLEKSFSVGLGGVLSNDVRLALHRLGQQGYTVIAGLGGRAITKSSLHRTLREAIADKLEPLTFMDLDWRIVNRQLEREALIRRSGPIAENLLRDVGMVASKVS